MKIENYFEMAKKESDKSNCLRRHIGAIIVKKEHVIGKGANMIPSCITSCKEKGECIRNVLNIPRGKGYDVCPSVHAEISAIKSTFNNLIKGSIMYLVGYDAVTGKPVENLDCCEDCKASIVKAGIDMVYINQENNIYSKVIVRNGVWTKRIVENE